MITKKLRRMSIVMAFVMFATSVAQTAPARDRVIIKAGTMLPLELATHISSKTAAGSAIDFRLLSNIVVDGNVVIRGGSIARGQVQRVRKNKLFGQPGKLEIVVRSITAVDGTFVALAGGQLSEEGSDRLILSIMLTIFVCLLCFLIKGGDAEIPAGTQCVAIIPSDVEIEI